MDELLKQMLPYGITGATALTAMIKNPDILKIIYQDLAQPSVKKVGIALGTVFGLSNTLLLPIKLLNERTKLLFQNNMERYKIKLNEIPEDIICEVPPEIGIPVIEKLTYIQDINISELYINLLAKA